MKDDFTLEKKVLWTCCNHNFCCEIWDRENIWNNKCWLVEFSSQEFVNTIRISQGVDYSTQAYQLPLMQCVLWKCVSGWRASCQHGSFLAWILTWWKCLE